MLHWSSYWTKGEVAINSGNSENSIIKFKKAQVIWMTWTVSNAVKTLNGEPRVSKQRDVRCAVLSSVGNTVLQGCSKDFVLSQSDPEIGKGSVPHRDKSLKSEGE